MRANLHVRRKGLKITTNSMQLLLLCGLILMSFSAARSQNATINPQTSNKKENSSKQDKTKKSDNETLNNNSSETIIVSGINDSPASMGTHAPDINDPEYDIKKEEWINNFPEEYNYYLKNSGSAHSGEKVENNVKAEQIVNNIHSKAADHAPDINDPDYATKKTEWIKNYPEEYKASLQGSSEAFTGIQLTAGSPVRTQKLGDHAPDMNDPDYINKKEEWIKNYPEEYYNCLKTGTNSGQGTKVNTYPASNNTVVTTKPKAAEHAPDVSDPNYGTKKAEWIKNYPGEYNAMLEQNSKNASNHDGKKTLVNTQQQGIQHKAGLHAPDYNDPDYKAKKEEWIKNYPQEYEQLLNEAGSGQNK